MEKRYKILLILSILFLISGCIANIVVAKYVNNKYKTLPLNPDYLFEDTYFTDYSKLCDLLPLIAMIIGFALIFILKLQKELPYYLILFGIFQFLRASFIFLTPIGTPYPLSYWGLSPYLAGISVFPSGHISVSAMLFFISYYKKKYFFSFIFAIITIILFWLMILSRGHYTIDMLSSIIFCYAIYSFGERHIKSKVLNSSLNTSN